MFRGKSGDMDQLFYFHQICEECTREKVLNSVLKIRKEGECVSPYFAKVFEKTYISY